MADTRTRIINLPEATTLDPSMNFVEDSADGSGTRRVTYDTLKGAINQEVAVNLAPAYSNAATYNVGDLCTYQGTLYTCNTQISTAEDWTAAHWTLTNMASDLYQLKSDLIGNGVSTVITGWIPHYYIKTDGTTVDITSPVQAGDQRMRYVIINCTAGDIFRLEVAGGSSARAYCFIDADSNVLEVADANAVVHNMVVAPTNAVKLILNDLYNGDTTSWIGLSIDQRLDNLESVYVNNIPIVSGIFQRSTAEYMRNTIYMTTAHPIALKSGDRVHLNSNDATMGFLVVENLSGTWANTRAFSSDDYIAKKDENVIINIRNSSSTDLTSDNVKDIALLHYHSSNNKYVGTANEKIYFLVTTNSHAYVNNPDSAVDTDTDSEAYVIQNAVVALPLNYSADETANPVPVVMLCHGFTGNVAYNQWYSNNTDFLALVTALTNAGYAVFDVADTSNSNSGNICDLGCPQLLEAYYKAFEYIKKNYNVQDKCLIYGMSHGTYTALNMVREHGNIVKAVCVGGAVVSCYYYFMFQNGAFASTIARKFGFIDQTGGTYETDKMIPYDNYANMLTISEKEYLFGNYPPIKILLGGNDNAEMNSMVEETFGAIKNGGNLVYLRTVDGYDHHNITTVNSAGLRNEVITFYNRYK